MQCSAVILSNMTKTGQQPYIGKVMTKDAVVSTIRKQCKNGGPNRIIRGDKQYPTCGQHNNDRACLIAECGLPYTTVAVINDSDGATHINLNTKEESVQEKLPFSKDRNQEILDAEEKKATIDKLLENSKVMEVVARGEAGLHKVSTDFIVAGTGSRSLQVADRGIKEDAIAKVTAELIRLKEKYGSKLVILSGMAEGFDKLLALKAIELEIRLWVAIPNKGYGDYYWGRNSLTGQNMKAAFDAIVSNAEKVVYVMEDIHQMIDKALYKEGRHANFIRNDYMVEVADAFLVWDPSSRGTRDCFTSIRKAKKPYKVLTA